MLHLIEEKHYHSISYKNRLIFKIDKSQPIITLGQGRATYKMSRGSFKIKEKARKYHYYYKKHQKNDNYLLVELHGKDQRKIDLEFKVKNNRLHIRLFIPDPNCNRVYMNLWSNEDEKIYGCGEQFVKFNLKGEKVRIWVSEHISLSSIIQKVLKKTFNLKHKIKKFNKYSSYMVQPTFLTSNKMFCHLDTMDYSAFDFRYTNHIGIEVRGIPNELIIGIEDDYARLLENMTDLLGRQPELPEWVYNGLILGIQDGTDSCLEKLKIMKEAGTRISGIWSQDWSGQRLTAFGKQVYWDWVWDKGLYHDLDQQIKKWKQENIAFLGYINPFLAVEGKLYKEASKKGYVVKNIDGEDYMVKITTFPAAMIDLSNPEACTWIKHVIKDNMLGLGMKGWMADFGEYLPTDAVLHSGESAVHVHNQWPALWAKVNREAIEESGKLGKIVFFTRAGYIGTSKYSLLMWNGDQHVDWSRDYGIGSVINAQMSLSVSGLGLSHSDIGGYTTFGPLKRNKELLLRWTEMAAFTPFMRLHEGNKPDANWQFDSDKETIEHIAKFTNVYTRLKPYIKEAVRLNHEKGMPVIKPLFFYYEEENCYDIEDSYLFGRDLLVSPVLKEGSYEKKVVLPDDDWIHLWTGEKYQKGEYIITSPIGQPPVFFRASSKWSEVFNTIR